MQGLLQRCVLPASIDSNYVRGGGSPREGKESGQGGTESEFDNEGQGGFASRVPWKSPAYQVTCPVMSIPEVDSRVLRS